MKETGILLAKNFLRGASWYWRPFSRLILYGDSAGWVLDWEMRELKRICYQLGVPVVKPIWKHAYNPQSIFFSNQFFLQSDTWMDLLPNRIGFAYFHGLPGTGDGGFDRIYHALEKYHENITRIQVSHTEVRNAVLRTNIDPSKVFQIPIGINLEYFPLRDAEQKRKARLEIGVPQAAFVVGSFQKDGVGWGDGFEPKLIKGPDVFVDTMKRLKKDISELFVLLSGPARGYVKKELAAAGIPYLHIYQKAYPEIVKLFQTLDLYIVASRQEGGPKAILESMASGVPLVTTKVGQAMDLVHHSINAWMVDVEDVDALTAYALQVYYSGADALRQILIAGRKTAEANSYESQIPLWAKFMKGFVG